MTPTDEDFRMFQGNTKKVVFETTGIDNVAEIDGIEWIVVASNDQSNSLITKTYPDDISFTEDTETGLVYIELYIETEDTINLEPRKYIHELELSDTDSTKPYITTISRGELRLVKSIIS